MEAKKVYEAIAQVTLALSKEGIAKRRRNQQQGYQFRGIDDVYNALAPFLADAKLCILPNVLTREVVERETKAGGALFYTTVRVEFAFVSAIDGSEHKVTTFGEAMDSGDKSTNKAMSAAYKYAAMQAFCIPTEGDNDADAETHDVRGGAKPAAARPAAEPEDPNVTEGREKKVADWCAALEGATSLDSLKECYEKAKADVADWVSELQAQAITKAKNKRARELVAKPADAKAAA